MMVLIFTIHKGSPYLLIYVPLKNVPLEKKVEDAPCLFLVSLIFAAQDIPWIQVSNYFKMYKHFYMIMLVMYNEKNHMF